MMSLTSGKRLIRDPLTSVAPPLLGHHKGVSHAFKLWGDLRPLGQSLDPKFLLQHYTDQALVSFIAKILLDPRA